MVSKTIKNDLDFLRQVSQPVDITVDDLDLYVNELRKYCIESNLYALAPVQIGIPKRMIYIRNTSQDMAKNDDESYSEEIVLINPTIVSSKGLARFLERCGSCLDYVGIVDRPYSVEVLYYDVIGKQHKNIFSGFKALVFCHEYDHLNGILHIDRAQDVFRMSREETRNFRNIHPYEIVSEDCDYTWNEVKPYQLLRNKK